MISIVYSTRNSKPEFKEHLNKTVGFKDIEIIEYINNGEYSLTEIYNKGLKESKNDIVIFCHDDIIFNKPKWGKKILSHFKDSDFGILGIAGTTHLSETGRWWDDNTKMMGIVKHHNEGKTWESKYCRNFNNKIIESVIIDGLFICVNKNKIKESFNEDVKGFHFYDIDFCFNNHLNGVKVGVIFDVKVTHLSIGATNDEWEKNRLNFTNIYKDNLPYNIKGEILVDNKPVKLKNKPKVGLIIPTKSNLDLLFNCIDSFYEKDDYDNIRVYIADTGSSDDEIKKIKSYIIEKNKDINLLIYDYYHFAKINNDVVNNHIGDDIELLLFCNNDIKLINNAITKVVNVYLKNKNVGTIGARLHFGDNTIQHSGMTVFLREVNKKYVVGLSHYGLRSYYNYHYQTKNVLGNTGAFLLINKKLFNNIGQFSEEYSECFEDVELNIECLRKNKKNIFVEDAVCYHYESQTRNKDEDKLVREGQDYQKIIPKIISNKKTYEYFTNVKPYVLEQIFSRYNETTIN